MAAVACAAEAASLTSETSFDVDNRPSQDFLSEHGFYRALRLALRVRENGLIGLAPVCSSFVTLNCKNTLRNKNNFEGNEMYQQVHDGNHTAKCATFLLCIAIARGTHVYLENPASSMIFSYLSAFLSPFQGLLSSAITNRCVWSVEPYGDRYKKAFKFLHDAKWLEPVQRKCQCPDVKTSRRQKNPDTKHKPMVKINGSKRTGILTNLKESQSYPDNLGEAIIAALLVAPHPAKAWPDFKDEPSSNSAKDKGWGLWAEEPGPADDDDDKEEWFELAEAPKRNKDVWSDRDEDRAPAKVAKPTKAAKSEEEVWPAADGWQ